MAKPRGQNTTKPRTIKATVAGVQSGRSSADWFISNTSLSSGCAMQPDESDVGKSLFGVKENED